ncbi:hypothetical protein PVAP13_6NG201509 [Panicum virgatum]|uniref:Uncharacterized protein n=1 Tax=Panicum virgatum TaxID=38727 RepID=A0A8T0QXF2_PANVG|nr:hypothetical protein PVAP13_6NG201509 [Panicum virgatum]
MAGVRVLRQLLTPPRSAGNQLRRLSMLRQRLGRGLLFPLSTHVLAVGGLLLFLMILSAVSSPGSSAGPRRSPPCHFCSKLSPWLPPAAAEWAPRPRRTATHRRGLAVLL